jgi:surfeit locus 1 family protein
MLRLSVPTIAAIAVALSALSLGNWQTRRAAEKETLKEQIAVAKAQPAISANEVSAESHDKRRVQLTGLLMHDKTVFVDNRTHKGQAGFHVLTPLKIDGASVLINRGWIVRDVSDRTRLPAITSIREIVTVVGLSQADLIQSYELAKAESPKLEDRLWQSASLSKFTQWSGLELKPFVIRQTEALKNAAGVEVADGLVRDWAALNTDVDKHIGYAVQWYSLSALSVILWVWFVLIKRLLKKK